MQEFTDDQCLFFKQYIQDHLIDSDSYTKKLEQEELKECSFINDSKSKFINCREFCDTLRLLGETEALNQLLKEVDEEVPETFYLNVDQFINVLKFVGIDNSYDQILKKIEDMKLKEDEDSFVNEKINPPSYSREELVAYSNYLNQILIDEKDLKDLLPLSLCIDEERSALFEAVQDGRLLCRFINKLFDGLIDERVLNKVAKPFSLSYSTKDQITRKRLIENQILFTNSARYIGVKTMEDAAQCLIDGTSYPHVVLAVVWQLIRISFEQKINLKNIPELIRLSESKNDINKQSLDEILLRQINNCIERYIDLNNNNIEIKTLKLNSISNFEQLTQLHFYALICIVINKLDENFELDEIFSINKSSLPKFEHIQKLYSVAQELGNVGGKSSSVLCLFDFDKNSVSNILTSRRVKWMFAALILTQIGSGLNKLTQDEENHVAKILDDFDQGDSREERAFRLWINSLCLPNLSIGSNLYEDCVDGLVLLKVLDFVEPDLVDQKKVELRVNNRFKKIANCNYVIVLGKKLNFSLVAIGGVDIVDSSKKLVLAFIWQLMRYHTIKFLNDLTNKSGQRLSENEIIEQCNDKVAETKSNRKMKSFQDISLKNSLYFLDLLSAIDPPFVIDQDLVSNGMSHEEKILNARYTISIARKLGLILFLLPEDIVECKPKMILTFCAAIMAYWLQKNN